MKIRTLIALWLLASTSLLSQITLDFPGLSYLESESDYPFRKNLQEKLDENGPFVIDFYGQLLHPNSIFEQRAVIKMLLERPDSLVIKYHFLNFDSLQAPSLMVSEQEEILEAKRLLALLHYHPLSYYQYILVKNKYYTINYDQSISFDYQGALMESGVDPDVINAQISQGLVDSLYFENITNSLSDRQAIDSLNQGRPFITDILGDYEDFTLETLIPRDQSLPDNNCCDRYKMFYYFLDDEFIDNWQEKIVDLGLFIASKLRDPSFLFMVYLDVTKELKKARTVPCSSDKLPDEIMENCGPDQWCLKFQSYTLPPNAPSEILFERAECVDCPKAYPDPNLTNAIIIELNTSIEATQENYTAHPTFQLISEKLENLGLQFSVTKNNNDLVYGPEAIEIEGFEIRNGPVFKKDRKPRQKKLRIKLGNEIKNMEPGEEICINGFDYFPSEMSEQCQPINECFTFECPAAQLWYDNDNNEIELLVQQNQDGLIFSTVGYVVEITKPNEPTQTFTWGATSDKGNLPIKDPNGNLLNISALNLPDGTNICLKWDPYYFGRHLDGAQGKITSCEGGEYCFEVGRDEDCNNIDVRLIDCLPPTALGANDGVITVGTFASLGGPPPYSPAYIWDNGTSGPRRYQVAPGPEYCVTVTDVHQICPDRPKCFKLDPILCCTNGSGNKPNNGSINNKPTLSDCLTYQVSIENSVQPDEQDFPNGSLSISITNSLDPANDDFTYVWSDLDSNDEYQRNNLEPGKYCVTISLVGTCCNVVECFEVLFKDCEQSNLDLSFTTQSACNADGSIDVTASGGFPPYEYDWFYNGLTESSEDLSSLNPDYYFLTVTDSKGCKKNEVIHIDGPYSGPFEFEATINPAFDCLDNGSIEILEKDQYSNLTFNWSTGYSGRFLEDVNSGNYSVTISDGCGFSQMEEFFVPGYHIEPNNQFSLTIKQPCNMGQMGLVDAYPYNYEIEIYNLDFNLIYSGHQINLPPGDYYLKVFEPGIKSECYYFDELTISSENVLGIQFWEEKATCDYYCDGKLGVLPTGGTFPYSISWENGSSSMLRENLNIGTYSVTITDGSNCTMTGEHSLTSTNGTNCPELNPIVLYSKPSCPNSNNGSLGIGITGGVKPYVFNWADGGFNTSNGGPNDPVNKNNLAPGDYQVTITDRCGNQIIKTFTIFEAQTYTGTLLTLENGCSTGLSHYSNDAVINIEFTPNTPNNFTLMMKYDDFLGAPNYNHEIIQKTISNQSTFTVGGTLLEFTAFDGNNCEIQTNFKSGEFPDEYSYPFFFLLPYCISPCPEAPNSGSISYDLDPNRFSFNWSNGSSEPSIQNLNVGFYTVTISDNTTGCIYSIDSDMPSVWRFKALISEERIGEIGLDKISSATPNQSNGALDITIKPSSFVIPYSPPFPPYPSSLNHNIPKFPINYSWSNGANTEDINNLSAGNYTVTVTDARGCQMSETFIVPGCEDVDFEIHFEDNNPDLLKRPCGAEEGHITLTLKSNGQVLNNNDYTFNWDGPGPFTIEGKGKIKEIEDEGTYHVTVTSTCGILKTASYDLSCNLCVPIDFNIWIKDACDPEDAEVIFNGVNDWNSNPPSDLRIDWVDWGIGDVSSYIKWNDIVSDYSSPSSFNHQGPTRVKHGKNNDIHVEITDERGCLYEEILFSLDKEQMCFWDWDFLSDHTREYLPQGGNNFLGSTAKVNVGTISCESCDGINCHGGNHVSNFSYVPNDLYDPCKKGGNLNGTCQLLDNHNIGDQAFLASEFLNESSRKPDPNNPGHCIYDVGCYFPYVAGIEGPVWVKTKKLIACEVAPPNVTSPDINVDGCENATAAGTEVIYNLDECCVEVICLETGDLLDVNYCEQFQYCVMKPQIEGDDYQLIRYCILDALSNIEVIQSFSSDLGPPQIAQEVGFCSFNPSGEGLVQGPETSKNVYQSNETFINQAKDLMSVTSNFVITPNPNSGRFSLHYSNISSLSSFNFKLLDATGKIYWSQKKTLNSTGSMIFENTNLSKGLYLLIIEGKDNIWRLKLIIK